MGGPVPDSAKLSSDPGNWESNQHKVIEGGLKLGVKPVLSAKDMAHEDGEHLGIMAYATWLQWVKPRAPLTDMLGVRLQSTSGRVGEPTYFKVESMSREIEISSVKAYVNLPTNHLQPVKLNNHGEGMFIPDNFGMHEIVLEVEDNQ